MPWKPAVKDAGIPLSELHVIIQHFSESHQPIYNQFCVSLFGNNTHRI